MRLQIGSSSVRIPGYANVDIRPVAGVDVVAHAGDLAGVADGSVDAVFSNAFFEHVFIGHQRAVLAEWRRVLAPDGVVALIGIPDFREIARCYLDRSAGILSERFDLYHVYRYTHGDPEQTGLTASPDTWGDWDPGADPDAAPAGWLPQLHKGLFDVDYLHQLLDDVGLFPLVFTYPYPGEAYPLCLGAVAVHDPAVFVGRGDLAEAIVTEVLIDLVPGVERFVDLAGVRVPPLAPGHEGMLDHARRLDGSPAHAGSATYAGR